MPKDLVIYDTKKTQKITTKPFKIGLEGPEPLFQQFGLWVGPKRTHPIMWQTTKPKITLQSHFFEKKIEKMADFINQSGTND